MENNDHNFNLTEVHLGGDYDSAFEPDSDLEQTRLRRDDLAKQSSKASAKKATKEFFTEEWSREEGRKQRFHLLSMDAYSRHKKLVNEYILCYSGTTSLLKRDRSKDKTELDVLKENHKFLWDDEEGNTSLTWEQRLAKKYYDKLFKEYSIADLTCYKENKVALRWRTEQEVITGRGQFTCGNKHCSEKEGLRSWEVNFAYLEQGQRKNALVKLRLCPGCSYKLNYHHKRKEIKPREKRYILDSSESASKKVRVSDEPDVTDKATGSSNEAAKALANEDADSSSIWKEPVKVTEDKSQEEEFDDYLADMFL